MDSIDYYNKYASAVFEDTIDQDMSDIMHEFLAVLESGDTILDLGCGSGRDSLSLYELGYDVTPLDASEEMCKLAEIHTGLEVLQMTYEEMDFRQVFDGIWACGALIHIPKEEFPAILRKLARALKNKGILYMSLRLGDFDGFRGERYYSDFTESSMEEMLREEGSFKILKTWTTEDVRSEKDIEWLNVLARKL